MLADERGRRQDARGAVFSEVAVAHMCRSEAEELVRMAQVVAADPEKYRQRYERVFMKAWRAERNQSE